MRLEKGAVRGVALAFLLALASFAAASQAQEVVSDAYGEGLLAFEAGDYERAAEAFEAALAQSEAAHGPEHEDVATDLNNLAEAYRRLNRLDEARALLERAVKLDERLLGPDDPQFAVTLNNLGLVLRATGESEQAEAHFWRALQILEDKRGENDPEVAKILNNLAVVYQARGEPARAAPFVERAGRIAADTLDADDPTRQSIERTMTMVQADQERTQEAVAQAVATDASTALETAAPGTVDAAAEVAAAQAQRAAATEPSSIEPGAGGFRVHLASIRSADGVADEWRRLRDSIPPLVELAAMPADRIETDNGVFYRVSGGPIPTRAAADALCDQITSAGQYCAVLTN